MKYFDNQILVDKMSLKSLLRHAALGHQQLHNRVNRSQHFCRRHIMVVAENREHKALAGLGFTIAGESVHMAERTGLGMHQSAGRSVEKAIGQRTIHAAEG